MQEPELLKRTGPVFRLFACKKNKKITGCIGLFVLAVFIVLLIASFIKERGCLVLLSPTDKKVLEMAYERARVEVENAQSAVIKIPEGYLFIIPTATAINDGTYQAFYSPSGDFENDSEKITAEKGELISEPITFMGHRIDLWTESAKSVSVCLFFFDEASIAKYDGTEPNRVNIEKLKFTSNPTYDNEVFDEAVLEKIEDIRRGN